MIWPGETGPHLRSLDTAGSQAAASPRRSCCRGKVAIPLGADPPRPNRYHPPREPVAAPGRPVRWGAGRAGPEGTAPGWHHGAFRRTPRRRSTLEDAAGRQSSGCFSSPPGAGVLRMWFGYRVSFPQESCMSGEPGSVSIRHSARLSGAWMPKEGVPRTFQAPADSRPRGSTGRKACVHVENDHRKPNDATWKG